MIFLKMKSSKKFQIFIDSWVKLPVRISRKALKKFVRSFNWVRNNCSQKIVCTESCSPRKLFAQKIFGTEKITENIAGGKCKLRHGEEVSFKSSIHETLFCPEICQIYQKMGLLKNFNCSSYYEQNLAGIAICDSKIHQFLHLWYHFQHHLQQTYSLTLEFEQPYQCTLFSSFEAASWQ